MANVFAVGRRGLDGLVMRYGSATVTECLEEMIVRSEKQMRSYIAEIPDGTYDCCDNFDNDGIVDKPIPINLTVKVEGDAMHLDFTGTAGPDAWAVQHFPQYDVVDVLCGAQAYIPGRADQRGHVPPDYLHRAGRVHAGGELSGCRRRLSRAGRTNSRPHIRRPFQGHPRSSTGAVLRHDGSMLRERRTSRAPRAISSGYFPIREAMAPRSSPTGSSTATRRSRWRTSCRLNSRSIASHCVSIISRCARILVVPAGTGAAAARPMASPSGRKR